LIAENDECLGAYLKDAKTDAAFDSLARLYVAMTRAKQGLFAIIEPAGNSKACSYPRLLTGCLGTTEGELLVGTKRFPAIARAGDDRWILPGTEVPKVPEWSAETVGAEVAVNRLERKVASDYVDHASSLADVFGASMRVRAGHGTAVHELLAKIEWSDSVDIDRWAESATNEGADPAAVKEAVSALMRPEFETVFVRPGKDWEAWRERALEAMVDGVWVSAVIDRACIRKNAEGAIEEARIFEFKTGTLARTGHGAEPPRGRVDQLAANRRVIAEATGLPVQKVEAFLVYTGSGNLVDLTGRGQPD
ncbi:MAG TPA: hypothetical protein VNI35_08450, partial [Nitrospira sp.]|nr:hypothetical protein [Nitrospira sp.]